jgi:hypothetical protein
MVTMLIYGVFSVGMVWPDRIRQILQLSAVRPVLNMLSVTLIVTNHFLKKNQVGVTGAKMLANMR